MSKTLKKAVTQMIEKYLDTNPNATEEEVNEYLFNDLCDTVSYIVCDYFESSDEEG